MRSWLRRAQWADVFGLGLALSSVALTFVITSGRKFLWYDEMFAATFATAPSLGTVVRAIAHGADTAPPLFFMLAWGWVRLAEASGRRR